MIFNKYKEFGFSLVEAMVGLGLMTAVGVGVMQLQGQQVKTQKNLDADYEIKMLTSIIYNQLKHDKACFATFDGMDFSGPSEFGVIKNENGDKVFSSTLAAGTAEIFKGKNDIEIVRYLAEPDSMASFSDMGDGTKIGKVRIAIEYRKVNQILKNDNVYKKYLSLPIRVRLTNSDNHVNNCISGGDEATITALNQFCESLNGVLDESDPLQPRCQLGGTTDYESGNESYQGFSAAAFQDFMADYAPAVFVLRKDTGSGPAMEGPLNADKNISLTEEPTEGYHAMRKIDFDMRVKCGSGLIGIMTGEGLKCREKFACSNSGDDNQQYLAGIDGDGNPVCNNLIEGVECATGGGTLKVKPDGRVTFDCCSPVCSDAGAYCTGQTYESSNGCGLCTGTKPASSATQTWVDTGDVRDTSGCMDGYIQTEKKQISQCSGTSECGGATCTPNEERWVAGTPKACSTCQPAIISIFDVTENLVKLGWTSDYIGPFKVELMSADFGIAIGSQEVHSDSDGKGTAEFTGLNPSTQYGLRIGYYCDPEDSTGVWSEVVFTTLGGEAACVEGDHKVGDLYEHTQNTKYCAPYTGDIWTYKRMVCEGGVYRWDGLYLRRTQEACDPETPMPPLESALADVSHTGGLDPCNTGESGFDDYKRTTNANGTWNWCQWRFEGGGGCFIAGSQVTMADRRQVNIEDIEVGEKLLTTSGQINTVKKLIRIDYKGLIYSINGSDYFFTPNHPLKTLTGWKSLRPDLTRQEIPNLKVEKLKLGDILIKDNGLEIIMSLDSKYTEQKVYNFGMDGDHEFIVNDIGVHNKL